MGFRPIWRGLLAQNLRSAAAPRRPPWLVARTSAKSSGVGAPPSSSMRGMRADLLTFEHAKALARKHGTPLLALSREVLLDNYRALRTSLPNVDIYYAIKANPHREVLRLLHRAGSRFDVSFSLAGGTPATLAVYDVSGRRIESREVGSMGAGLHVVTFGDAAKLRPGLYMVRLSQLSKSLTTTVLVVP